MTKKVDYHAKGQIHAKQGKFDPPHSSIREQLFGGLLDSSAQKKQKIKDAKSYRAGYVHGKRQRD